MKTLSTSQKVNSQRVLFELELTEAYEEFTETVFALLYDPSVRSY